MNYEGFNLRMYSNETEFEKTFPKYFVNGVKTSYLKQTHSINIKEVAKMCKKHNLTYSTYQQMESLFLAKLQRVV